MSVCQSFPTQDTYCTLDAPHEGVPHHYRSHHDHDFDKVLSGAEYQVKERGATIYQKFTCQHCGQRLTLEEPNALHESGTCDQCGKLTDIRANGCNYIMVMRTGRTV